MLLSDLDIKKELNTLDNLMIYPLDTSKIKGSSINLTASKFAWRVSDKNSAVENNKIIIPPNDTVCIYTKESIWVSRRISGTYHSKVSLVSKGLGHVSTTLDPQWLGLSLIAINNPTSSSIEINVGSTFVTLMLCYVNTDSTKGLNENADSRQDLANMFNRNEEALEHIRQESNRSYEGLKKALLNSIEYKEFKSEFNALANKQAKQKREFRDTFWYPLTTGLIAAIFGGVISGLIVWGITNDDEKPPEIEENSLEKQYEEFSRYRNLY